jgi:[glutamine synthetase] adenylyltransferase / [glutamine synthetase]-adenylyl-L-tyrosine phosphorylase
MFGANFETISFADKRSADASLLRISSRNEGFESIAPGLLAALSDAADPDRSLINFERFIENYGPDLVPILEQNLRVLEILITLFSASQFLTEILLRNPQSIDLLIDRQQLTKRKTIEQIQSEAEFAIRLAKTDEEIKNALRRYQQGELLRIGASDFLDLYDLPAVVSQISRMAIALTRICLSLASRQTDISAEWFVVLAMGKLGGRELNYSSDIDLLFIARNDSINFIPLAQKLIDYLASTTDQGFLYRVDMRLRPWGKDGPLIPTISGFLKYLENNARPWEKQALLKVRPIAGDLALGEELREAIFPIIYGRQSEEIRSDVFAMKQRTEEFLVEKGRQWGEVKLGIGSIRDIEFVVQYLQLANVSKLPQIRTRATLKALPRLRLAGLLTSRDTRTLTDGYIFFRTIEHYLQMMDYRQTYTLPSESTAISILARRLGFHSGDSFIERYQEHSKAVRAIYLRYIGNEVNPDEPSPIVRQHISRMDSSYTDVFSPADINKHALLSQKLKESNPVVVDAISLDETTWRVTIVGYDYPGELSIICGLFFVHGFDILDGFVFTYEPKDLATRTMKSVPATSAINPTRRFHRPLSFSNNSEFAADDSHQKIVDVFTVKSVTSDLPNPTIWDTYTQDLHGLLAMFHSGKRREARGQLAKRVGAAFHTISGIAAPLLPVDIEIDNDLSDRYTVLRIDAPDTIGFLYEFTNALAFTNTNIARMIVRSIGSRAQDVLYVTDANNKKILSLEKQRELRAAIVLIKHFTHLLPYSPNPETALLHFREFLLQLFQRPNWTDEIISLERSEVLKALARILGVSDFLWDDLMRMQYENLFPVVRDVDLLATGKARNDIETELAHSLKTGSVGGIIYADWRAALNAFKDRELFRIDMRHILGLTSEFWDFASELTDLAETVITAALDKCEKELLEKHGNPNLDNGFPCGFSIFALGKCGGSELGFASDIELMCIYSGKGRTSGPEVIDTSEFFEKLVRSIITTIHARQEGIFQIDLQIRPYGKSGSLAVSLEAFRRYYSPDGPAWAYERQSLVKLRPIAGNPTLCAEICMLRDDFTYNGSLFDVTAMRAMREKQVRHLVTGGTFNAKYSPGGLVDIEYLIQGLQINYGADNPILRVTNIRKAMALLNEAGILNKSDYASLRKAHTFLRWLIDSLRVVRGNAKDVTVPEYGTEEFAFLARRLRYENDTDSLRNDLLRYQTEVQEINTRLLRN